MSQMSSHLAHKILKNASRAEINAYFRAAYHLANTDGNFSTEELGALLNQAVSYGLSKKEIESYFNETAKDKSLNEIIKGLSEVKEPIRQRLYGASLLNIVYADGDFSGKEQRAFLQMKDALDLSDEFLDETLGLLKQRLVLDNISYHLIAEGQIKAGEIDQLKQH